MKRILFVCLGNICRSPLAEGVFRHLVSERGLEKSYQVDSCGTGAWHVGDPPHRGSRKIAKENGITLEGRARVINREDFDSFDLLVAMDRENLSSIQSSGRGTTARMFCLREYDSDSEDLDVPDPYYTGDFQSVFDIVYRCCNSLLDELEAQ